MNLASISFNYSNYLLYYFSYDFIIFCCIFPFYLDFENDSY